MQEITENTPSTLISSAHVSVDSLPQLETTNTKKHTANALQDTSAKMPSHTKSISSLEEFLLGCEDRVDKLGMGISEWNKTRKRARYIASNNIN